MVRTDICRAPAGALQISFVVESWDEVQEYWWNNCRSPWFEGTVIHVVDKPKPKSKGFK